MAACLLAVALALLPGAGEVQAQTTIKLVGNIGQSTSTRIGFSTFALYADGFTTGSHGSGYTLKSVELDIRLGNPPGTTDPVYNVSIWSSDTSGDPGSNLGTLTNPSALSTGTNTFSSSSGIDLDAATTYFVVFKTTSVGDRQPQNRFITSNNEDANPATGWSIADALLSSTDSGSSWSASASGYSSKFAIHGYAKPAVTIEDASADEGDAITFTVTLNAAITDADGFTVTPSFSGGTATKGTDYTLPIDSSNDPIALTFAGNDGEKKTFTVSTTQDTDVEPDETFIVALTVSGAAETVIATDTATGTINNDDSAIVMNDDPSQTKDNSLQSIWLSRFGRTVVDQVTGAVSDRLAVPLAGAQVTVGGQSINLARAKDKARVGETAHFGRPRAGCRTGV